MAARRIPKISVLAVALGVSESAVSRWRANGPMTLENVMSVCTYLDISADWFLFGNGPMDRSDAPCSSLPWVSAIELLTPAAQRHLLLFLTHLGRPD